MKQSYRILLLEDSASDAELTALQLTKVDLKFKLIIVSTKKEFDQEFYSEIPDLVICDYNLPKHTGIEVLTEVHEYNEELPFILVSGFIDASIAVEAMVKGASDYVMKDDLSRLAPAATRELIHYSKKRKQQRLLDEAYKLASIGYWEYRPESKELFWSDQVRRVHEVSLDYQPDLDTALSFYKAGIARQTMIEAVENAILFGESYDVELEIISAKGNSKWIHILGQAEMDQGKCLRIFGSTQDVTERKTAEFQAKKAEQKLRNVVEYSTNLFYEHDTDHKLTYISPQSNQLFGLSPEDSIKNWKKLITDHPQNKRGIKYTQKAIDTGRRQPTYELQLKQNDGTVIWVTVNEAPVVKDGKTIAIVGSLTDITDQKQNQEKLEMLSKVASETQNQVIITGIDGRIEWVNKAFEERTGYSFLEAVGKNPTDLLYGPDTDDEIARKHKKNIKNEKAFSEVMVNYTKEGEPFWAKINVSPIFGDDGKLKKYFSIQEDITKEVEFQNQLQQKSLRLETSQKIGDIGDWYFIIDTGEIFWSDHMYAIYERDVKADTPEYDHIMTYYPDEWERHDEAVQNAVQKGKSYSFDIRMITERGSEKFLLVEGRPVKDQKGNVYRLNGTVMDITSRKKAELELKNREEQLKNITNNIDGMIQQYKRNADGTYEYIYISEGIRKLHGLSPEQAYSSSATISEQVIEEDKASVLSSMEKSAQSLEQWDHKYRVRLPDGTVKWIHGKGTPKKVEDGAVLWNTIKMDITEQEELKELLEQAYQMARIGVWELEPQKGEVYWSSVTKEIHEAPPNFKPDLESSLKFYAEGESRDMIQRCVIQAIEEGVTWDEELQIVTLNGNKKWIRTKGEPEFTDGKCQRIYGIFQDIHERKDAQLKVIQGFKEREQILDRINEGFFAVDEHWTVTYWNGMAENIMGMPRSEVLNQNLWDTFPEVKDLKFFQNYHQAVDSKETASFEEYFPPLDMWIEVNAYPSDDGLSIFFRNITNRKLREKKLEDSLQEKETLLMEIHHRVKTT
jgi:PAS domain S-box-containing protein